MEPETTIQHYKSIFYTNPRSRLDLLQETKAQVMALVKECNLGEREGLDFFFGGGGQPKNWVVEFHPGVGWV